MYYKLTCHFSPSLCAIMTREIFSWNYFNLTSKLTACIPCHMTSYPTSFASTVNYIVVAIIKTETTILKVKVKRFIKYSNELIMIA